MTTIMNKLSHDDRGRLQEREAASLPHEKAADLSHLSEHNLRSNSEAETARTKAILVLHKLRLEQRRESLLKERGVRIIHTGSVGQTLRALEEAHEPRIVVVDLSVGSQAPEQIIKACAGFEHDRKGRPVRVIPCTSKGGGQVKGRARKMQVDEVFLWPEGAFGQIMIALEEEPGFALRRIAERAEIQEEFDADDDDELNGKLINLSASGAMLECNAAGADVVSLALDFDVPDTDLRVSVTAMVRWSEMSEGKVRLGVEFVGVTDQARAAIEDFVRKMNVLSTVSEPLPARSKRATKARVTHVGTGRVDYFLFEGEPESGGTLVPKKGFFVPYKPGDALCLELLRPRARARYRTAIADRILWEPDRVDSRIAWRVGALAPEDSK